MFNRLCPQKFRLSPEELQDVRRYIGHLSRHTDTGSASRSLDLARRHNQLIDIPCALAAFLVNGSDGYEPYQWYDLPPDMGPPFRYILSMMIYQYGLGKSCRYAGIRRRTYYKLFDPAYRPSKDLVIRIALGNELSLGSTNILLNRAGYTFELSSHRDLILDYCFQHCIFDVRTVNNTLRQLGQRPLARK